MSFRQTWFYNFLQPLELPHLSIEVSQSPPPNYAKARANTLIQKEEECSDTLKAAFKRISELEKQLEASENERKKLDNLLKVTKRKLSDLTTNLSKFLGRDQIQALSNTKVQSWTNKTLKKAYILRIRGGKSLLKFVNTNICPIPTDRTLRRKIQNLPFAPGILKFNIQVLASVITNFTSTQKHFGIVFDEKSLVPGNESQ